MSPDMMKVSADMIFTDAVHDLSARTERSVNEIRTELIESGAYAALYDFDTDLWQTGPDYLIGFHEALKSRLRLGG